MLPLPCPASPLLLIYIKQTRNLFKYIAQGRSTPPSPLRPSPYTHSPHMPPTWHCFFASSNPRKIHNRYTQPLIPTHTHTDADTFPLFVSLCFFFFCFPLVTFVVVVCAGDIFPYGWFWMVRWVFFSSSLSFSLMNNERCELRFSPCFFFDSCFFCVCFCFCFGFFFVLLT